MRAQFTPQTIRQLIAADGYLDLNLPAQALRELESIEDAGLYEAPRQFLLGRTLKLLDRLEDAVAPLEQAARMMPSPFRRMAWQELSECYRHVGSEQLAQIAESLAGSAEDCDYKLVLPQVDAEISLQRRETDFV